MDVHQSECDQDQRNFEADFCEYSIKLDGVCNQLDTCYDAALTAWGTKKTLVKAKEVSHKELLTAIARVDCLIGLFDDAKTKNLVAGDVTACLNEKVDTSDLDVVYDEAEDKKDCDTSPKFWDRSGEYAALNQTHLEPSSTCFPWQPLVTYTGAITHDGGYVTNKPFTISIVGGLATVQWIWDHVGSGEKNVPSKIDGYGVTYAGDKIEMVHPTTYYNRFSGSSSDNFETIAGQWYNNGGGKVGTFSAAKA
jgi:hypothetical protein